MKKHIFRSICLATITVFVASFVLILGVLYSYFSRMRVRELESATQNVAQAVELNGMEYLGAVSDSDYRITWVAADGSVIYDNRADVSSMGNHLEREEIREALENGEGESARYSTTLMEREYYCAERLNDGTVIRLSSEHLTWWALILGMIQPIAVVIIIAVTLSVYFAGRLSERIIKPLNSLDLDNPDEKNTYEELSPLLSRISVQKIQLEIQENELKKKKNEFEMATDNMPEGIILLGINGTVISINKSAGSILGISQYSVGKDFEVFCANEEILNLIADAKNRTHAEKVISIGDRDYQFNASPVITDDAVTGVALIFFDITEKERAENMRREFTANVSHELKTPLQTISGYAELLSDGLVKPDDAKGIYGKIYTEAKRMITLINDIIKLSHLDESASEYDFEPVDVYETAQNTVKRLAPAADGKDISVELTGEKAEISGIPQFVSEIIYNLCENAIKYNKDGGSVKVNVRNSGDCVVLSVKDTGIGISADDQEHIFERFYRADKSHSKNTEGTGLGLSIVKHAAIIHNADVKVASKVGEGTEFTVTFPKYTAV